MDNIIRTEMLRFAKICGERRLEIRFHYFIKSCPGKSKKTETTRVTACPSLPLFSFQEQSPQITLESSCSKVSQNPVEINHGGFFKIFLKIFKKHLF